MRVVLQTSETQTVRRQTCGYADCDARHCSAAALACSAHPLPWPGAELLALQVDIAVDKRPRALGAWRQLERWQKQPRLRRVVHRHPVGVQKRVRLEGRRINKQPQFWDNAVRLGVTACAVRALWSAILLPYGESASCSVHERPYCRYGGSCKNETHPVMKRGACASTLVPSHVPSDASNVRPKCALLLYAMIRAQALREQQHVVLESSRK